MIKLINFLVTVLEYNQVFFLKSSAIIKSKTLVIKLVFMNTSVIKVLSVKSILGY